MKGKSIVCSFVCLLLFLSCNRKSHQYDASGAFEAVETIISAEASGKIQELNIEEGQELKAGEIIGYIDSTQLHLSKLKAQQNKKAILISRPQTSIQIDAIRKELANATLDRNRTAKLVEGGVASQKQLDDANARVATLQSRLNAQENSLNINSSTINEQGTTVDAQLNEINEQLKHCIIINPLNGTVLSKYAEQYEMVVVGKPLYKIANLAALNLRAYITGDQLTQAKLNQNVRVFTDDGKGGFKEARGQIIWINNKAEFTPKTIQTKNERANLVYAIKVKVINDGSYKIGMYGEISFQ